MAMGGTAPVVVAGLLVELRSGIGTTGVALALVLAVAAAAVLGGTLAGVVAAISAALSFDFFHTRPYLSLAMDTHRDVTSTTCMLVSGIGVALLAGTAQSNRARWRTSRAAIEQLRNISGLVATGSSSPDILLSAQSELTTLLDLRSCRFETPPFETVLPLVERNGAIAGTSAHRYSGREFELPRATVALPVLTRGMVVGRFVLEPTPGRGVGLEHRVVAVAIADQVGAAFVPQRST
jgi:K+-sensing histidine kinase KdpD